MNIRLFLLMIVLVCCCGMVQANDNDAMERLRFAELHYAKPADSLHNEEKFIAVLEDVLRDSTVSEKVKLRPRLLLEQSLKNRIGSVAADLELVDTAGNVSHLHQLDSVLTLVFFNSPDCGSCQINKERLDTIQVINDYVNAGLLKIVAIYPYDDKELWRNAHYPSNMLNFWNEDQAVYLRDVYELPCIPVYFLLNRDRRIIMKNEVSLNRIMRALERIMVSSDRSTEGLLRLLYNP